MLMMSAHAWRTSLAARLEPLSLTPSQFFVVMAVSRQRRNGRDALNQRQVAKATGMDVNVQSSPKSAQRNRG